MGTQPRWVQTPVTKEKKVSDWRCVVMGGWAWMEGLWTEGEGERELGCEGKTGAYLA